MLSLLKRLEHSPRPRKVIFNRNYPGIFSRFQPFVSCFLPSTHVNTFNLQVDYNRITAENWKGHKGLFITTQLETMRASTLSLLSDFHDRHIQLFSVAITKAKGSPEEESQLLACSLNGQTGEAELCMLGPGDRSTSVSRFKLGSSMDLSLNERKITHSPKQLSAIISTCAMVTCYSVIGCYTQQASITDQFACLELLGCLHNRALDSAAIAAVVMAACFESKSSHFAATSEPRLGSVDCLVHTDEQHIAAAISSFQMKRVNQSSIGSHSIMWRRMPLPQSNARCVLSH